MTHPIKYILWVWIYSAPLWSAAIQVTPPTTPRRTPWPAIPIQHWKRTTQSTPSAAIKVTTQVYPPTTPKAQPPDYTPARGESPTHVDSTSTPTTPVKTPVSHNDTHVFHIDGRIRSIVTTHQTPNHTQLYQVQAEILRAGKSIRKVNIASNLRTQGEVATAEDTILNNTEVQETLHTWKPRRLLDVEDPTIDTTPPKPPHATNGIDVDPENRLIHYRSRTAGAIILLRQGSSTSFDVSPPSGVVDIPIEFQYAQTFSIILRNADGTVTTQASIRPSDPCQHTSYDPTDPNFSPLCLASWFKRQLQRLLFIAIAIALLTLISILRNIYLSVRQTVRLTWILFRILFIFIHYILQRSLKVVRDCFPKNRAAPINRNPIPAAVNAEPQVRLRNNRELRRLLNYPAIIFILCLAFPHSDACSHAQILSSTLDDCKDDTCLLTFSGQITLPNLNSEACISILNEHDSTFNQLLRLTYSNYTCYRQLEFLYYTTDYTTATIASSRCVWSGAACTEHNCASVQPQSTAYGNIDPSTLQYPGRTSCISEPPLLGCFLREPTCLFHRFYVRPSPYTYISVYKESGPLVCKSSVTLSLNNHSSTVALSDNQPITLNGLRLHLIGRDADNTITDSYSVLIPSPNTHSYVTSSVSPPNHPERGLPGDIQSSNSRFPPNSTLLATDLFTDCNISPQEINCQETPSGTKNAIIPPHRLPLTTATYTLQLLDHQLSFTRFHSPAVNIELSTPGTFRIQRRLHQPCPTPDTAIISADGVTNSPLGITIIIKTHSTCGPGQALVHLSNTSTFTLTSALLQIPDTPTSIPLHGHTTTHHVTGHIILPGVTLRVDFQATDPQSTLSLSQLLAQSWNAPSKKAWWNPLNLPTLWPSLPLFNLIFPLTILLFLLFICRWLPTRRQRTPRPRRHQI